MQTCGYVLAGAAAQADRNVNQGHANARHGREQAETQTEPIVDMADRYAHEDDGQSVQEQGVRRVDVALCLKTIEICDGCQQSSQRQTTMHLTKCEVEPEQSEDE